jgi:hypothetical protein
MDRGKKKQEAVTAKGCQSGVDKRVQSLNTEGRCEANAEITNKSRKKEERRETKDYHRHQRSATCSLHAE